MRTLDGQKQWSKVQYREGKRMETINIFTLPSPISLESLRGIYHQFTISNIRLGVEWTWVDGLDLALNTTLHFKTLLLRVVLFQIWLLWDATLFFNSPNPFLGSNPWISSSLGSTTPLALLFLCCGDGSWPFSQLYSIKAT